MFPTQGHDGPFAHGLIEDGHKSQQVIVYGNLLTNRGALGLDDPVPGIIAVSRPSLLLAAPPFCSNNEPTASAAAPIYNNRAKQQGDKQGTFSKMTKRPGLIFQMTE